MSLQGATNEVPQINTIVKACYSGSSFMLSIGAFQATIPDSQGEVSSNKLSYSVL